MKQELGVEEEEEGGSVSKGKHWHQRDVERFVEVYLT